MWCSCWDELSANSNNWHFSMFREVMSQGNATIYVFFFCTPFVLNSEKPGEDKCFVQQHCYYWCYLQNILPKLGRSCPLNEWLCNGVRAILKHKRAICFTTLKVHVLLLRLDWIQDKRGADKMSFYNILPWVQIIILITYNGNPEVTGLKYGIT